MAGTAGPSYKSKQRRWWMVAPNDGIEAEDDDVGVLIYIERQLRKKKAEAAAESREQEDDINCFIPYQTLNFNKSEEIA
eukprot:scaffold1711_cov235-Skeletonema_marinoi.AAC.3